MRMIDADELIEHVWRDRLDSRERIANLVKSMPTIKIIPAADVAPVVHGYWIVHENADVFEGYEVPMFECSKCRAWKEDDSDFCPDCGADMRGEQDDSV